MKKVIKFNRETIASLISSLTIIFPIVIWEYSKQLENITRLIFVVIQLIATIPTFFLYKNFKKIYWVLIIISIIVFVSFFYLIHWIYCCMDFGIGEL